MQVISASSEAGLPVFNCFIPFGEPQFWNVLTVRYLVCTKVLSAVVNSKHSPADGPTNSSHEHESLLSSKAHKHKVLQTSDSCMCG